MCGGLAILVKTMNEVIGLLLLTVNMGRETVIKEKSAIIIIII
jgi:hypothetical protein